MAASIFEKYSPEIVFGENAPVAITDGSQKIIWFSNSFKESFPDQRLKGKTLTSLLNSIGIENEAESVIKKPVVHQLNQINKELQITPLFAKNKKTTPDNYKLELVDSTTELRVKKISGKSGKANIDFRIELQHILTLLVKENSIDKLSSEILSKSINLTNSDLGLITFINENSNTEFKYLDPQNLISNKLEVEKTITSDFKFITKWLILNKTSLVATN